MVKGYNDAPLSSIDTRNQKYFGNTIINFNSEPKDIQRRRFGLNFAFTNSSVCDTNGQLLFLSNGVKIFNKNYELMENGDSINDGYFVNVYAEIMRLMGYVSMQGAIIIKKPNSTSTYYLLHSYIGFSQELNIGTYGAKLLATEIDMSANNGLGKVISKNKTIIDDTIGTSVSACRHANGEVWWIVVQEQNSNCFYKVLIDKNGISPNIKKDCEGPPSSILVHYSSSSCFSPNGKTYTYLSRSDGLYIFDYKES